MANSSPSAVSNHPDRYWRATFDNPMTPDCSGSPDYSVDILGGSLAVHYPSKYRQFDGIMVPARRRATSATPTAPRPRIRSRSPSTSPMSHSTRSNPCVPISCPAGSSPTTS